MRRSSLFKGCLTLGRGSGNCGRIHAVSFGTPRRRNPLVRCQKFLSLNSDRLGAPGPTPNPGSNSRVRQFHFFLLLRATFPGVYRAFAFVSH